MSFEASGAILSTLNERSRGRRAGLVRRLLTPDMLMYLAYVVYTLVPLALHLQAILHCRTTVADHCQPFPLPGVLIKTIDTTWKASVPIRYMIRPPTVPERRELMEQDRHGVWRPRPSALMADIGPKLWSWMDVWEALVIAVCWVT